MHPVFHRFVYRRIVMEDLAGVAARKDYNDEVKLIRALGFNSSATTVYNDMDAI